MPSRPSSTKLAFTNNCVNLHDLAAIILDCHWRTEERLPSAHLIEVNHGVAPIQSLPPNAVARFVAPQWHALNNIDRKRVAYILQHLKDSTERVSVDAFAPANGVALPPGTSPLTRRDIENIYWRCKDYDKGYELTYVLQEVIRRLPDNTILLARTSSGHELKCSVSEVVVGEIDIRPHEACLIIDTERRPDISPTHMGIEQHLSGFDASMPWVFLIFGKGTSRDPITDPRVILDLALPQIGGRGAGGELFALERMGDYHAKVLPTCADEVSEKYDLSLEIRLEPAKKKETDVLLEAVLERLEKVGKGDVTFCRYCGRDNVLTRCSKCREAHFCQDCQVLGWKYHKVWCGR